MKIRHIVGLLFAIVAVHAADPAGTWTWPTPSPGDAIETALKFETKDGKLIGAYSNQFGDTAIGDASLEGDTIKGTIEAPGHEGSAALKLDWVAKRVPVAKASEAKPGT